MGLDIMHLTPVKKGNSNSILEFISLEDLSHSPDYLERHTNLVVDLDLDEYGIEKGIYFDSKGYQRKGVQGRFYSDFENDRVYFDLQSVLKAYNYLAADHISTLPDLQHNFQQNFIDNFIEGESIFVAGW